MIQCICYGCGMLERNVKMKMERNVKLEINVIKLVNRNDNGNDNDITLLK